MRLQKLKTTAKKKKENIKKIYLVKKKKRNDKFKVLVQQLLQNKIDSFFFSFFLYNLLKIVAKYNIKNLKIVIMICSK